MQTLKSDILVQDLVYGESPRWHDGRLWFSDVHDHAVKSVDAHGQVRVEVRTQCPSGLGWLPDGTLLIATLGAAHLNRVTASGVELLHDLSDRGWSLNDMVVAPDGRAYADLYHRSPGKPPVGDLLLITPEGQVSTVARGLATPNGIALTPDGKTLVVSETYSGKLLAFDVEPDGSLTGKRVFADLGAERRPDGLCLDAAGAAWVGSASNGEFFRVLDGEVTHRMEVASGWAVATALGGADRRTLYLVIDETTNEGLFKGESTGRIETVRVEVPGAGLP